MNYLILGMMFVYVYPSQIEGWSGIDKQKKESALLKISRIIESKKNILTVLLRLPPWAKL